MCVDFSPVPIFLENISHDQFVAVCSVFVDNCFLFLSVGLFSHWVFLLLLLLLLSCLLLRGSAFLFRSSFVKCLSLTLFQAQTLLFLITQFRWWRKKALQRYECGLVRWFYVLYLKMFVVRHWVDHSMICASAHTFSTFFICSFSRPADNLVLFLLFHHSLDSFCHSFASIRNVIHYLSCEQELQQVQAHGQVRVRECASACTSFSKNGSILMLAHAQSTHKQSISHNMYRHTQLTRKFLRESCPSRGISALAYLWLDCLPSVYTMYWIHMPQHSHCTIMWNFCAQQQQQQQQYSFQRKMCDELLHIWQIWSHRFHFKFYASSHSISFDFHLPHHHLIQRHQTIPIRVCSYAKNCCLYCF